MNKTGGELSILGDVPPSLSKEFNTSINDSTIIHNDTNTTIVNSEAVNNSIDNNNTSIMNGIDREEKISQIVNSALEKARSRADEGGIIVNDTLEKARSDNAMDNFKTVTEMPIPPKSPKIQEATSNELTIPPKSPNRIIQVDSSELPILESNLQSTNQLPILENDNKLESADQIIEGEINEVDTTNNNNNKIHIGKIGNPIGSLGTLWDSVTTEQEMVNVNVSIGDDKGEGE